MVHHPSRNATLPSATANVDASTTKALMKAKDSHFKFLYFNVWARSELPRMILSYVDASWEEVEFDWGNQKPLLPPFHQVPVLWEENVSLKTTARFVETKAIERYLGEKYDLLGSKDNAADPLEHQRLDEIYNNTDGVSILFDLMVLAPGPGEARLTGARGFYAGPLKNWAEYHEGLLNAAGNNGHYLQSGKTTIADLKTALMVRRVRFLVPEGVDVDKEVPVSKEKTPALWKLKETINAHPPMAKWVASARFNELDVGTKVFMGFEEACEE
ncbi:Glutathione S-transferase S1 [Actinomortierella ambigua]|nr:Glutathione S-transferase S1 [Actinomortierella ambigua]